MPPSHPSIHIRFEIDIPVGAGGSVLPVVEQRCRGGSFRTEKGTLLYFDFTAGDPKAVKPSSTPGVGSICTTATFDGPVYDVWALIFFGPKIPDSPPGTATLGV